MPAMLGEVLGRAVASLTSGSGVSQASNVYELCLIFLQGVLGTGLMLSVMESFSEWLHHSAPRSR